MILFFDTNILHDVALRREPHFANSQAVLSEGIADHTFLMSDFEDAMQIAAAMASGTEMIVTRGTTGFIKSPIPVGSSLT